MTSFRYLQPSLDKMSSFTHICQRVSNRLTNRRSLLLSRASRPVVSRTLLTPTSEIPHKTPADIIASLSKTVLGRWQGQAGIVLSCWFIYKFWFLGGHQSHSDPDLYHRQKEELLKILPTDQSQLPPRRMIDSFDCVMIPLSSDSELRVNKTSITKSFVWREISLPEPLSRIWWRSENWATPGEYGHLLSLSR